MAGRTTPLEGAVQTRLSAKPDGSANGLSPSRVAEIQRARLIGAMGEICVERGASNATVAHVVERAGVSRRTFYEIFEDCDDCLQAAFSQASANAAQHVSETYEPGAKWIERIRSALEALLRFLDEEPVIGRLLVVESISAGTKTLQRRRRVLAQMVAVVDAGREEMGTGASATTLTAEGLVGGVSSVIHGHMLGDDPGRLSELVNPLVSMIALPYLGPAAARRELERPPTRLSPHRSKGPTNPLKDLDMRLTYRTVRVLGAVAANTGSSNRVIGDASGIGDQGQISKLLARLEKLGLVENARTGLHKGSTNIWMLTEHGREVADVIAAQATHP